MKKEFSAHWKSSVQARKQRKFRFNAHIHARRKLMSANLMKELRKKIGRRSIPLRKGDTVKIMVGEFKKQKGKVLEVDNYKLKVYVEGIQRKKKDGTKVNVPLDPSNLQITEIAEDKKRNLVKKSKETKK
jgi:large subunit ribosomal protein L24